MSGPTSLALNRLAIGAAGRDEDRLGELLRERGRRMIGIRAGALLEAGRTSGHIVYSDRTEAFETLYGLIITDLHVRLLLGEQPGPAAADLTMRARRAIDQFFRLYAAQDAAAGLMDTSNTQSTNDLRAITDKREGI